LATPVASVPLEFVRGPLSAAVPVQPLAGELVGDAVGEAVGDDVGDAVGLAVGEVVGLVVGLAVGDGVGDGVAVLVPPLSVSAVESMKKLVSRLPVCFEVHRRVALPPANDERFTVSWT
jgi:hypothetical protein